MAVSQNNSVYVLWLKLCHFLASIDPESETEEGGGAGGFRAPTKKEDREPETERAVGREDEGGGVRRQK